MDEIGGAAMREICCLPPMAGSTPQVSLLRCSRRARREGDAATTRRINRRPVPRQTRAPVMVVGREIPPDQHAETFGRQTRERQPKPRTDGRRRHRAI